MLPPPPQGRRWLLVLRGSAAAASFFRPSGRDVSPPTSMWCVFLPGGSVPASVVSSSAAQAVDSAGVSASSPAARRGLALSYLPTCGAAPPLPTGRKGVGRPRAPPPPWTTTSTGSPSTLAPTPCAPPWSLVGSASPPRHACRVVVLRCSTATRGLDRAATGRTLFCHHRTRAGRDVPRQRA
jgi:hypothetical protein